MLPKTIELWVAVALMNKDGINFFLNKTPIIQKQNYIVGIDLPTHPYALKKLFTLQSEGKARVRIYINKKRNYHPKLYVFDSDGKYSAFVGSANCTNGGLFKNVEISTKINDAGTCKKLIELFEDLFLESKPLTKKFIAKYEKDFKQRQKRKQADDDFVKREKEEIDNDFNLEVRNRSRFIKSLLRFRNSTQYDSIVLERQNSISRLKRAIDYPRFDRISVESFFTIQELGHLVPIAKPAVVRMENSGRLKQLLIWLCDDTIDIAIRYQEAIDGTQKLEGIGKAFISKILVIHRPLDFFVKNEMTEMALSEFGLHFSHGKSEGQEYRQICLLLSEICKETRIDNLAVLDHFLYNLAKQIA